MIFPKKKTFKKLTIHDVIASWLRDEWHYRMYDKKHTPEIEKIVLTPNTEHEKENELRRKLLSLKRGKMLDQIPKDTTWYLAELTQEDFNRSFLINTTWCRDLTNNSCKITELIKNIDRNLQDKENEHIEKIKGIKQKATLESISNTTLILIGPDLNSAFTVIEGNHRIIGILSTLKELGSHIPIKIILGIHDEIKNSPLYLNQTLIEYYKT